MPHTRTAGPKPSSCACPGIGAIHRRLPTCQPIRRVRIIAHRLPVYLMRNKREEVSGRGRTGQLIHGGHDAYAAPRTETIPTTQSGYAVLLSRFTNPAENTPMMEETAVGVTSRKAS